MPLTPRRTVALACCGLLGLTAAAAAPARKVASSFGPGSMVMSSDRSAGMSGISHMRRAAS